MSRTEKIFNKLYLRWEKEAKEQFQDDIEKQIYYIDKKIIGYKHNCDL